MMRKLVSLSTTGLFALTTWGSVAAPAAADEVMHLEDITVSSKVGDDPDPNHFHQEHWGRCDLLMWITADGVVRFTQVIKSTGHSKIDDACLKAVSGKTMVPATSDGRAIDTWAIQSIAWEAMVTKPGKPPEDIGPIAPIAPNQHLPVTAADYPKDARERGEQGQSRVHAEVAESGQVLEVHIVESSGSPDLDQASLAAVRSARFNPAFVDQKPVAGGADVVISWVPPVAAAAPLSPGAKSQ